MSIVKKILTIIIILVALSAGLIGFWFYQNREITPTPAPNLPTIDEFFPVDTGENSSPEEEALAPGFGENLVNQSFGQGLNRLLDTPISDFQLNQGSTTSKIYYVDKSTGHLYEKDLLNNQATRLSNYTAPGLTEAKFFLGATSTIDFWAIKPEASGQILLNSTGDTISPNLIALAPSPDQKKVFLLEKVGDGVIGSVLDWQKLENKKVIFRAGLSEWLVSWPTNDSILLNTKPAANYAGLIYKLDPNTSKLTRLIGNSLGLAGHLSPDGTKLVYSQNTSTGLSLNLLNLSTKETTLLGIQTLAEKCVWTSDSKLIYCAVPIKLSSLPLPDAYYRGEIAWQDNFWQINTDTGESYLIFETSTVFGLQNNLDASRLSLNPAENRLIFQNRPDSTLWSLSWE